MAIRTYDNHRTTVKKNYSITLVKDGKVTLFTIIVLVIETSAIKYYTGKERVGQVGIHSQEAELG